MAMAPIVSSRGFSIADRSRNSRKTQALGASFRLKEDVILTEKMSATSGPYYEAIDAEWFSEEDSEDFNPYLNPVFLYKKMLKMNALSAQYVDFYS